MIRYRGHELAYVIDGVRAVESCWHFAGYLGVSPRGLSWRRLWLMAEGKLKNKRRELLEQATLVWSLQDLDAEIYLASGTIETTGRGGPVQLDPHMQARVDAEVARIRAENPDLPKVKGLG